MAGDCRPWAPVLPPDKAILCKDPFFKKVRKEESTRRRNGKNKVYVRILKRSREDMIGKLPKKLIISGREKEKATKKTTVENLKGDCGQTARNRGNRTDSLRGAGVRSDKSQLKPPVQGAPCGCHPGWWWGASSAHSAAPRQGKCLLGTDILTLVLGAGGVGSRGRTCAGSGAGAPQVTSGV